MSYTFLVSSGEHKTKMGYLILTYSKWGEKIGCSDLLMNDLWHFQANCLLIKVCQIVEKEGFASFLSLDFSYFEWINFKIFVLTWSCNVLGYPFSYHTRRNPTFVILNFWTNLSENYQSTFVSIPTKTQNVKLHFFCPMEIN